VSDRDLGGGGAVSGLELETRREQLIERFTLTQLELGGLFYEMAIRDHLELDVLAAKSAALQQLDLELAEVQALLATKVDTTF
jgi:hypothetical protein